MVGYKILHSHTAGISNVLQVFCQAADECVCVKERKEGDRETVISVLFLPKNVQPQSNHWRGKLEKSKLRDI